MKYDIGRRGRVRVQDQTHDLARDILDGVRVEPRIGRSE